MSEHDLQASFFDWASRAVREWPELDLMFAIPNGGHRNKIVAAKLKREGVKAGVADIFLPVPKGGYSGMWMELKYRKGKLSDAQLRFLTSMVHMGYYAVAARDWEALAEETVNYLKGEIRRG